jgi:hypothetical protein
MPVLGSLAGIVPPYATAVVLLLVGSYMFRSVKEIDFGELEDAIPAFVTIILIPLTFSITQGILWGFISHTALYLLAGRAKELKPLMYIWRRSRSDWCGWSMVGFRNEAGLFCHFYDRNFIFFRFQIPFCRFGLK